MATHSSILAWRIQRTAEPGGLQSTEGRESDTTERLSMHSDNVGYCRHIIDEKTEVQRQQKQKQNWPKQAVLRMAAGLRHTPSA